MVGISKPLHPLLMMLGRQSRGIAMKIRDSLDTRRPVFTTWPSLVVRDAVDVGWQDRSYMALRKVSAGREGGVHGAA